MFFESASDHCEGSGFLATRKQRWKEGTEEGKDAWAVLQKSDLPKQLRLIRIRRSLNLSPASNGLRQVVRVDDLMLARICSLNLAYRLGVWCSDDGTEIPAPGPAPSPGGGRAPSGYDYGASWALAMEEYEREQAALDAEEADEPAVYFMPMVDIGKFGRRSDGVAEFERADDAAVSVPNDGTVLSEEGFGKTDGRSKPKVKSSSTESQRMQCDGSCVARKQDAEGEHPPLCLLSVAQATCLLPKSPAYASSLPAVPLTPLTRSPQMSLTDLTAHISTFIDSESSSLHSISHAIHSRPELSHKESYAHALLADHMEQRGFTVERGACGLATAFVAEWSPAGKDGVMVAFLSE
ncbi:hypothetical protein BDK51DRAFT_49842 [Blyttiomyces helicus]|uniref:Peptidase M20 dimerisation domain-containing protein n=1 Tax=Blyttiomyces helicus TaxID=388810 RepID=A0A4P9W3E7_9FUNG|nr:hypothetical protein BDK51DRAFT_49842 [Blyttiomyces helicus]|eukprot:RKO85308.1 hypothetical protein BDK51DRAFT_49842 [Blyttiomyces helicus]